MLNKFLFILLCTSSFSSAASLKNCRSTIRNFLNLEPGLYKIVDSAPENKGQFHGLLDLTTKPVKEFTSREMADYSKPYRGIGKIFVGSFFSMPNWGSIIDLENSQTGHTKHGYYSTSIEKNALTKCQIHEGTLNVVVSLQSSTVERYYVISKSRDPRQSTYVLKFTKDGDRLKMSAQMDASLTVTDANRSFKNSVKFQADDLQISAYEKNTP